MVIIPEARVVPSPALYDIELDFAGLVYFEIDTDQLQKAYICAFTCMRSCAVLRYGD